jgi:hypothetical protein
MMDINEHGIECPVSWQDVHWYYKWLAIDADGEVWAYKNKPISKGQTWRSKDYYFGFLGKKSLPIDFTKCLWQRPESIGILIGKDAGTSIDVIYNTLIG